MLQLLKTLLMEIKSMLIYPVSDIPLAGYLLVPPDSMAPVNYLCQLTPNQTALFSDWCQKCHLDQPDICQ